MFRGWTEEAQRFFIGLQMDNSKPYFEAHRQIYLADVKGPLEALAAELEPEFGPARISRPNRDIRFSADKSPYKTNVYASFRDGGYLSLSAKGLMVAGGLYQPDAAQLAAYRAAVVKDRSGEPLAAIVEGLENKGYEIGDEVLKRVPPGFPPDHPRARLLRFKGLFAWKDLGLQPWLGTAEAKDRIVEAFHDTRPILDWVAGHLPAAQPMAGRRR